MNLLKYFEIKSNYINNPNMETLKADLKTIQNTTLMKQRTLWAILTTISRNGKVKKANNSTHSGLIHTLCKKGVILLKKSDTNPTKESIPFDEIISIECSNIQITNKNKFKTDQEISKQSKLQKRQLQQWEGEESAFLSFNIKDYKSWDQFEANAQKFGVISTYDENLYTTPVPHISELTEEQVLRAKMLEKELGESTKDNEENEDEEALFGAVIGSGRYENLPKPKKPFHKHDDKELYKKMKKGLKKNDLDNNSVGKLESL